MGNLLPLLVGLAVLPGLAAAQHHTTSTPGGPPPHSANVVAVQHEPASPVRGGPVHLHVEVRNESGIEFGRAIYCRVQGYACAPALNMTHPGTKTYEATIPWTRRFFVDVTTVGYKFELHYANGTAETTPTADYPSTPADLPAEGDHYYYYQLPKESPAPVLALSALGLLAAAALARRTRER